MKRAWVRPAIVAGVIVTGLVAIVVAQRGSVSTSEAATPDKAGRPRFVRPDMPSGGPRPLTADAQARYPALTADPARSSLNLREPQSLPADNTARPIDDQPSSRYPTHSRDSRYVTQSDVRDYRVEQEKQREIKPVNYTGEPATPGQLSPPAQQPGLLPPGPSAPSVLPPAGDSGPLPSSTPNVFPGAPVTPNANDSLPTSPSPLGTITPSSPQPSTLSNTPNSFPPASSSLPPATTMPSTPTAPAASGAAGNGKPGPKHLEGPQTPSLVIEKISPPEIQVGKPAKYTISVRNVGTGVAQDVEVHDELPAGTQLVTTTPRANRGPRGEIVWSIGAIKPNDEVSVHVELLPTAEGEIGSVATVKFASSVTGRSICTRPELVVDVTAPREVLIGEEYRMSIKVSNPGTGVAANVVLSEVVPAGFEHPAGNELEYTIGDLAPNESRDVELSLKAMKPGAIINRLNVRGEGPLQVVKEQSVTVVAPALEVAVEGARRRFLDRQALYTLAISNPGTAPAKDVSLVAYLPPGLDFVEANNAGQYDARTRSVHWLLEELPAREMGKVTLTTMPTEQGDLPLKIASTAQRGLSAEKNEVIRVEGIAALVFQVVDLADPIDVGGETTYEIRVANQGSKPAENVQIIATLPQELKPLGAEGPSRHDINGQQVIFQPLARLTEKSETVYVIRAQASRQGDVKISVQLKSSDLTTPVVKEEATRVLSDQ
jgi:uncharacterized repeat protein (TIGR01451 family)